MMHQPPQVAGFYRLARGALAQNVAPAHGCAAGPPIWISFVEQWVRATERVSALRVAGRPKLRQAITDTAQERG